MKELYDELCPLEQKHITRETFARRLETNAIVALHGKRKTVLAGKGIGLRINASVGLNSDEFYSSELRKIQSLVHREVGPDIMMDLSTKKTAHPLYKAIIEEVGCPTGTIPHYLTFSPQRGIDKYELLETIEQQAEAGVAFFTLHLCANLDTARRTTNRHIPVISRGGSLLLRDSLLNHREHNIIAENLEDIKKICRKYRVAVSVGSTFRPSTLTDALDEVHIEELEMQKSWCSKLVADGIPVLMEGIGHIRFNQIPRYVSLLRAGEYIPFMPLGPIVSDNTQGQDHITSSIGASYIATLEGADIINAVTREEHTGGIPNEHSFIEAIDAANTVCSIVNETRFPIRNVKKARYNNCMKKVGTLGCERCGRECPFLLNLNSLGIN